MSEKEFNQIFPERLRYYLNKYDITQTDLAHRLGVSTQSVTNWCKGAKSPRMDKIDAMCKIFHCRRSDLMEEPKEVDQRKIFARNLNKYLEQYDKTQKEVADAIGVIPSTFNTWCLGIALPRMRKVQALADYFHINKSDLIEDKNDNNSYYLDNDAAAAAQFLYENPDYKVLFDATRKVKPEDIQLVKELLDRFSEK